MSGNGVAPTVRAPPEARCEVTSVELLHELLDAPLPLRLRSRAVARELHRDVYLDTDDDWLHGQGVACRFRLGSDDRRFLSLSLRVPGAHGDPGSVNWQRFDAEVQELDAVAAVQGTSEPARRLRGMLDPARLREDLVLSTERHRRATVGGWLRRATFEFLYDATTLERGHLRRQFFELKIRRLSEGRPTLAALVAALQREHGLRSSILAKVDRARRLAAHLERESERRALGTGAAVALVVLDRGRVACQALDGELRLPIAIGSGEGAARHLLVTCFGSGVGELRLLGVLPPAATRAQLEVWLAIHPRRGRESLSDGRLEWLAIDELTERVGTPVLSDGHTIAALLLAARSDLLSRRTPQEIRVVSARPTAPSLPLRDDSADGADRLLDGDLSLLEFNARVLAMAEDERTPLLERLRYLAIVSSNLDELFMVRVSALKRQAAEITGERSVGQRTPDERLAEIRRRADALVARQERCFAACREELAGHGVRLARFDELDPGRQELLRYRFRSSILPALTPMAMTEAPGFPAPNVAAGTLSLLVVIKDPHTGPMHLATLRIPPPLSRFVRVSEHDLISVEEIVRDQVELLYPGRDVLQAHVFRVTRGGELDVDDARAGNLLQAIEEDARRRRGNPIVRVEVEHTMPPPIRTALLDDLRLDSPGEPLPLGAIDLYEAGSLVDLGALKELAALPMPELAFPAFRPAAPFPPDVSMLGLIREQDLLVHHPYDDFDATVLRFLNEAADDADVVTIKATLYRAGERSPIVDALLRAAAEGKEVVTFVELKARFDEERNALWARRLTSAGVHVVYGLVGLKNHAKLLLVTRREGSVLRRYAHIGTGNYHAATARLYTDLGLFTADDALTADVSDLFNELTGSSQWPRGTYRRLLVAPHQLLPALLARVEREAAHAREGRGGRIRLKINGLTEVELISALYRAARDGVEIDLIVRGICRLRPGVPGLSERIRVISIVGRFLEHARIYHFGNGGDDEYLIGSADWRGRNVRRRVEVVAPVDDLACRRRLDRILECELSDPAAWRLESDGSYSRPSPTPVPGSAAQAAFMADARPTARVAT